MSFKNERENKDYCKQTKNEMLKGSSSGRRKKCENLDQHKGIESVRSDKM